MSIVMQSQNSSYQNMIVCLAVIFSVLFSRVEELEQIIEHTENTAKVFDCAEITGGKFKFLMILECKN